MKQGVFITVVLVLATIASYFIYEYGMPDYIKEGGYLVIGLIAMTIMVITFIFERIFSLRKAQGRGSLAVFLKNVTQ